MLSRVCLLPSIHNIQLMALSRSLYIKSNPKSDTQVTLLRRESSAWFHLSDRGRLHLMESGAHSFITPCQIIGSLGCQASIRQFIQKLQSLFLRLIKTITAPYKRDRRSFALSRVLWRRYMRTHMTRQKQQQTIAILKSRRTFFARYRALAVACGTIKL